MKRFDPDVHHRRSIRLNEYDYSSCGMYYVTICAYEKRCILAEMKNERIHPSPIGKIVRDCWNEIPNHHPGVRLDKFVVMSNHLHGIIAIVGATHASPTSVKPGPRPHSLGAIVGSFKSAASVRVHHLKGMAEFKVWQHNYYEHVIRNEHELNLIRQYIISNPLQWELDRENPAFKGKPDGDEISEILKGNGDIEKGDAYPMGCSKVGIPRCTPCVAPTG